MKLFIWSGFFFFFAWPSLPHPSPISPHFPPQLLLHKHAHPQHTETTQTSTTISCSDFVTHDLQWQPKLENSTLLQGRSVLFTAQPRLLCPLYYWSSFISFSDSLSFAVLFCFLP